MKINSLVANASRLYSNAHNVSPVFQGAASEVAGALTSTQQNRVHENWGVFTQTKTALKRKVRAAEKKKNGMSAAYEKLRSDGDVVAFTGVSDNVGKGGNIRYETTTRHAQTMRRSNLPVSVQIKLASEGENSRKWEQMLNSGLHRTDDLCAGQKSDDLVRLNAIITAKCVDEALPGSIPLDLGPAPTRAAVLHRKRKVQIQEYNYSGVFEEGMAQPNIAKESKNHSRTNQNSKSQLSLWDRGRMLHPQLLEPYATVSCLLQPYHVFSSCL